VDYTAIGENINLASRMEGLNKYMGTGVLLTAEVQGNVGDRFVTRSLGLFRLKGFERLVEVFELVGEADKAESTFPWRESFAKAIRAFQKRDFAATEAALHTTLELKPSDGPTHFYLERLAELRSHPPPSDWRGEIELKEK
jgi:adenylate cyclase